MNNQKDNICQTDINDSPGRLILKRKINNYAHKLNLKNKRIKYLNQKVQRQQKSISSLKNVIAVLKDNNLLHQDNAHLLSECFGKNNYLISNLYKKNLGKKLPRKYSADLRRFALSLHFHSCKAYDFVRKEFDTILPHPRTLSKWYTNTEASPGFTKESLDTLTLKCKNTDHTIYCALVLDEMAIRQHIEWDGSNYHGYVNFGIDVDSDQLDIANECLVFMLVAINERWKLPVGYFLCKHLDSTQKSNLLSQCLDLVYKTGVVVVSVTFDGCSSNIGMTKNLGCSYDPNNFKTNFTINNIQPIVILPDPSHMIKLVVNC